MKKIRNNRKFMIAIIAVSALSLAFAAVALAGPAIAKTAQSGGSANNDVTITETLAKLLASDEVDPEASFQSIKLEDENGTSAYEVTFIQDDKPVEVNIDATSGATLSVQDESNEQELGEADDDNIEFEDENDDESLEDSEQEDDDYDTDGIDWQEEGENDTEN